MTRSVIDTNVLIRALIRPLGTVGPIVVKLQEGKYQIVYSQQLLDELTEKMLLPRIRNKYPVSEEQMADLFNLIIEFGKRVDPERHVEICRDPDDNHVIDVALAGEAEYVVTGDDDLLILKEFETVRFITPKEFLTLLNSQ
ncbi:MAG: putative toxin-antitoxin system toxin component, PIN family [Chloroflexota bacterium]